MGFTVTLSREDGSGGEEIARNVATALRLRVVGSEIIHQALEVGVPANVALESAEGREGLVRKVLEFLRGQSGTPQSASLTLSSPQSDEAYVSTGIPPIGDEYYLAIMESIAFDLASTDDILLLGRAGQMLLRGKPDTLHVRIHAPLEHRLRAVTERFHLTPEQAAHRVQVNDEGRAAYLRRHFKVDINDVGLYDLTINTWTLSYETAEKLIVEAATAKRLRA